MASLSNTIQYNTKKSTRRFDDSFFVEKYGTFTKKRMFTFRLSISVANAKLILDFFFFKNFTMFFMLY